MPNIVAVNIRNWAITKPTFDAIVWSSRMSRLVNAKAAAITKEATAIDNMTLALRMFSWFKGHYHRDSLGPSSTRGWKLRPCRTSQQPRSDPAKLRCLLRKRRFADIPCPTYVP